MVLSPHSSIRFQQSGFQTAYVYAYFVTLQSITVMMELCIHPILIKISIFFPCIKLNSLSRGLKSVPCDNLSLWGQLNCFQKKKNIYSKAHFVKYSNPVPIKFCISWLATVLTYFYHKNLTLTYSKGVGILVHALKFSSTISAHRSALLIAIFLPSGKC